ncbi:hypothetical protein M8J76_015982 [Diaphorina citri]|nr:hypothetical protein M8J76_015982 [Diaphorina citri]
MMKIMMELKMRVINVDHEVPSVHLLSRNRIDDILSDVEDVDYDGVEDEGYQCRVVEHQVPSVHLLSRNRIDDILSDVEAMDFAMYIWELSVG